MRTLNQDRLLITFAIAFAMDMCWITEARFGEQVKEFGAEGMRRALELALDEATRQTLTFADLIRSVQRALAAERN